MTTAQDIMTRHPRYLSASDSVHDAAVRMAEMGVGALPICGADNRLKGMITDRDVVVKELSEAGYKLVGTYDFTKADKEDYFLIFQVR